MNDSSSREAVEFRPQDAIRQIRETIKNGNVDEILAMIPDPRVYGTQGLLLLLSDHDIWSLLVTLQDPFVQYAVYRLFLALLTDPRLYKGADKVAVNPEIVHNQRTVLVHFLFQRLVASTSPSLSSYPLKQQTSSKEEQRAILQLLHNVLKHYRHWTRDEKLQQHADILSDVFINTTRKHAAIVILKIFSSTPKFWTESLSGLQISPVTQYEILVVLIDLEKTRWSLSGSQQQSVLGQDVERCHNAVVTYLPELQDLSVYEPHCLRKLFELIGWTIRRPTTTVQKKPLKQQQKQLQQKRDDALFSFSINTLVYLSTLINSLVSWLYTNDADLEWFSSDRATTFVFSPVQHCFNSAALPSKPPPPPRPPPHLYPIVSNPEVVRQLGRVTLSGFLTVLEEVSFSLLSSPSSMPPSSSTPAKNQNPLWSLPEFDLHLRQLQLFLFDWVGPKTIRSLLNIYGEDDADISWLLRTMSLIQQRLQELTSEGDSTVTLSSTFALRAAASFSSSSLSPFGPSTHPSSPSSSLSSPVPTSPLASSSLVSSSLVSSSLASSSLTSPFPTSSLASSSLASSSLASSSLASSSLASSSLASSSLASSSLASSSLASSSTLKRDLKEIYAHLHLYTHPFETLIEFLSTIGYDDQTLLDLLLVLDDQESGGMLGALMSILRNFTENVDDQATLVHRWQDQIALESMQEGEGGDSKKEVAMEVDDYDDDDDDKDEQHVRERILSTEYCLYRLTAQIRSLHQSSLFPYNPEVLLVVLERTKDVLSKILS